MATGPPTSGKAVLTLCLGLLSVVCGVLAFPAESDLLVLGVLVFWLAACVLGLPTWRASDEGRGRWLAGCGVGVATGVIVLGYWLVGSVLFVRDRATQIVGMNKQHDIVHAMIAYTGAHGGGFPRPCCGTEQGVHCTAGGCCCCLTLGRRASTGSSA